jgi:hypothetical protein
MIDGSENSFNASKGASRHSKQRSVKLLGYGARLKCSAKVLGYSAAFSFQRQAKALTGYLG